MAARVAAAHTGDTTREGHGAPRGALAQLRDLLHRSFGVGASPYRYSSEPEQPFSSYGMEQQGQIVEDCFRGHPAARHLSPFQPGRTNSD